MAECFADGSYRVSKEKNVDGQEASQSAEENLQKTDVQLEGKTIDEYLSSILFKNFDMIHLNWM